jgi:hypothetical protein
LAYNNLLLRGGHFYAPGGYESAMPTENFFYSHTYSFLYGEPTTLTGGYATCQVQDELSVNAGMDTGWNQFTSLNGKANFFFGVNWTSKDDTINVSEEVFYGNTPSNVLFAEHGGVDTSRFLSDLVVNVKLGSKWRYVLENTFGHDSNTFSWGSLGLGPASWTGWSNYLLYDINDSWGFGIRYERFEDLDGALVSEPGFLPVPLPGCKYNDLTIGLNWKPNKNVTLRSEARWDWAENSPVAPFVEKPYDDFSKNSQFTWGNDVVVRF